MLSGRIAALSLRSGFRGPSSDNLLPTCQRFLQTTTKAPRVVKSRPHQAQTLNEFAEVLPSIRLLTDAKQSGVLDIEPKQAIELLQEYFKAYQNPSSDWEKRLCQSCEVSPNSLYMLGMFLGRFNTGVQQRWAKRLVLSASALGSNRASFELIKHAFTTGGSGKDKALFSKVEQLAKEGGDPQAMIHYGRILLLQGSTKKALQWFNNAARSPQIPNDAVLAEAILYEGVAWLKLKNKEAARAAFTRAALELDSPSAYYRLSAFEEPGSLTQSAYLIKAASSGILEACHQLGVIESEKIVVHGEAKSLSDFGMAREWFEIAAAGDFKPSMLYMASMCRICKHHDTALLWLEGAVGDPEISRAAQSLKEKWSRGGLDGDEKPSWPPPAINISFGHD